VIDFRYHLVSIIAVFLALAVGLVVGATALAPKTEVILSRLQTELSKQNGNLSKDRQALSNQVSADQIFAQAAGPRLLPGLLTGEKAVLVVAPGADNAVTTGVTTVLHQAGAAVTGVINLSSAFVGTGGQNEATLTQLAQSLAAKAGVTLPTRSTSPVGGQQDAARLVHRAVMPLGEQAGDRPNEVDQPDPGEEPAHPGPAAVPQHAAADHRLVDVDPRVDRSVGVRASGGRAGPGPGPEAAERGQDEAEAVFRGLADRRLVLRGHRVPPPRQLCPHAVMPLRPGPTR